MPSTHAEAHAWRHEQDRDRRGLAGVDGLRVDDQSSAGRFVTDIDVVGDRLLVHRCEVAYEVTTTYAIIDKNAPRRSPPSTASARNVAVPALYRTTRGRRDRAGRPRARADLGMRLDTHHRTWVRSVRVLGDRLVIERCPILCATTRSRRRRARAAPTPSRYRGAERAVTRRALVLLASPAVCDHHHRPCSSARSGSRASSSCSTCARSTALAGAIHTAARRAPTTPDARWTARCTRRVQPAPHVADPEPVPR